MKKAILLAIVLLFSVNAYALQNQEDYNSESNLTTEETLAGGKPDSNLQNGEGKSFGNITEDTPPEEESSIWDTLNPFNWFK